MADSSTPEPDPSAPYTPPTAPSPAAVPPPPVSAPPPYSAPDAHSAPPPPYTPSGAALPPPQPPPFASTGFNPLSQSEAVPVISSNKDERLWATFVHLSGLVGMFLAMIWVPGNLLLPLVLWLVKREGAPFIDDQGKEAVNFQITVTLGLMVCFVLSFVCIGIPLLFALAIASLVLQIIAAIKSNDGTVYRYPLTIRLIR